MSCRIVKDKPLSHQTVIFVELFIGKF